MDTFMSYMIVSIGICISNKQFSTEYYQQQ